jgi:hypothetical protein
MAVPFISFKVDFIAEITAGLIGYLRARCMLNRSPHQSAADVPILAGLWLQATISQLTRFVGIDFTMFPHVLSSEKPQ